MSHLTPDELIDALDAALVPARRAHLDTCERCRGEAAALRALLGDVRASQVPEPSPLFWDHFAARVRATIGTEDARAADAETATTRWFHWPVLAPFAALALLVLALIASIPSRSTQPSSLATIGPLPEDVVADSELEWAVLADLVSDLDIDSAREAGLAAGPGAADTALLQLTFAEREELMRLLKEELKVGS
jgi:hypothetical protein